MRKIIKNLTKIIITLIFISQVFIVESYASEEFDGIVEYPVIRLSSGMIMPIGKNVRNQFNNGVGFSAEAKIPKMIRLLNFYLDAGIQGGFYKINSDNSDLLNIPVFINFGFSRYNTKNKFNIVPEIAFGVHIQSSDHSMFNKNYFGVTPSLSFNYKISEKIALMSQIRLIEIIGNYPDTQEWFDVNFGVSFSLTDNPITLHKPKAMYNR